MAWIERLIDFVPEMSPLAGGLLLLGGGFGMLASMMLGSTVLLVGATLVGIAGWVGPALSAKKLARKITHTHLSPLEQAEQEADARWRAFVAGDDLPVRCRMH